VVPDRPHRRVGLRAAARPAAYDAPFPSREYTRAARLFPGFVPTRPDDPERAANERAWQVLERWHKPFLTLFSSRDPITRGGDRPFLARVPGAAGQPHAVTRGAGHFLQEDKGPELAESIARFIAATPSASTEGSSSGDDRGAGAASRTGAGA
jgi:haloalkane dehalogenase